MDNHHKKKQSLIVHLIQTGSKEEARILIEKNITASDLNTPNQHGTTPLIAAIIKGNTNLIKLLLKEGADVNKPNFEKLTPLMYAVFRGDFNFCQLLLENGANLNAVDKNKNTALIFAVLTNQTFLVDYFIKKGANIFTANAENRTALDLAKFHGYLEVIYTILNFLKPNEINNLKIKNFDWLQLLNLFKSSLKANTQVLYDNLMPTIYIHRSNTFYRLPLEIIQRIMNLYVLVQYYPTWYELRLEQDLKSTYDFIGQHKKRPAVLFSSAHLPQVDKQKKETDLNMRFSQLTISESKPKPNNKKTCRYEQIN